MGFLMKVAAADWNALRKYADITPVDQLGRGDASYTEDIGTTLRTLHDLHRKGHISDEDYNRYRTEFIESIDPQKVYDAYRHEGVSHPDAQVAWDDYGEEAYTNARQFYVDAVNRGLMSPEQAQAQLNKIRTGAPADPIYDWRKNVTPIQDPTEKPKPTKPAANTQDLVFSYRPGKWVDTRTGQPVTAPVPHKKEVRNVSDRVAPPVLPATPVAPLPAVPALTPVGLSHMTSDTLRDIPGVTRTAPAPAPLTVSPTGEINMQAPTIDGLTTQSDKPVVAPAPIPVAPAPVPAASSAPVKAPHQPARIQHTYEDALNNGWSADAANTYGRGWVYRDNGDGTRTYRSPSQIKKLDPKAARGGITVDAPRPAPSPKQPAPASKPVVPPKA